MTLARSPLTPMTSRKVFMLVMRMTPATAVPRMRAGRARTTKAANGAAIMPPRRSAPTTDHGICAKLSARRNPRLADRNDELAGVHSADNLARLHAARGEQGGGGDWSPTAAARSVEEAREQAKRRQETFGNGPLHYRLLPSPEREASQDVHPEGEQEDGHHRRNQLLGNGRHPGNRDRAEERPDAARHCYPHDL